MSVFKRINVSDSFVVPYVANKSWTLLSESFDDTQVTFNIGIKNTSSLFSLDSDFKTNYQYDRLVYDAINTTYYPDFLPTKFSTASKQGTIWNDGTLSTSSYYNGFVNLGNLDTIRFFPTGQGATIWTINVPRQLTGDKILPTTFEVDIRGEKACDIYDLVGQKSGFTIFQYVTCSGLPVTESLPDVIETRCIDTRYGITIVSGPGGYNYSGVCLPPSIGKIYDDGNYNLFYSGSPTTSSISGTILSSSMYVGNVFYEQNIAVLTVVPYNLIPSPPISPSVTPSPTPSVTPSITPTVTPSISITPTVTPSISVSPTVTPSISVSPSVTPSISATPSITPSLTPTPSASEPVINSWEFGGTFATYNTPRIACANQACTAFYYANTPTLSVGQTLYLDNLLTTPFIGAFNRYIVVNVGGSNSCNGLTWLSLQLNNSGVIQGITNCP